MHPKNVQLFMYAFFNYQLNFQVFILSTKSFIANRNYRLCKKRKFTVFCFFMSLKFFLLFYSKNSLIYYQWNKNPLPKKKPFVKIGRLNFDSDRCAMTQNRNVTFEVISNLT